MLPQTRARAIHLQADIDLSQIYQYQRVCWHAKKKYYILKGVSNVLNTPTDTHEGDKILETLFNAVQ